MFWIKRTVNYHLYSKVTKKCKFILLFTLNKTEDGQGMIRTENGKYILIITEAIR